MLLPSSPDSMTGLALPPRPVLANVEVPGDKGVSPLAVRFPWPRVALAGATLQASTMASAFAARRARPLRAIRPRSQLPRLVSPFFNGAQHIRSPLAVARNLVGRVESMLVKEPNKLLAFREPLHRKLMHGLAQMSNLLSPAYQVGYGTKPQLSLDVSEDITVALCQKDGHARVAFLPRITKTPIAIHKPCQPSSKLFIHVVIISFLPDGQEAL